jgi:hypothetical protein
MLRPRTGGFEQQKPLVEVQQPLHKEPAPFAPISTLSCPSDTEADRIERKPSVSIDSSVCSFTRPLYGRTRRLT